MAPAHGNSRALLCIYSRLSLPVAVGLLGLQLLRSGVLVCSVLSFTNYGFHEFQECRRAGICTAQGFTRTASGMHAVLSLQEYPEVQD